MIADVGVTIVTPMMTRYVILKNLGRKSLR